MSEDPRLAKLREIDDDLAEKGWARISPWWWAVIEKAYASGVIDFVITGGRRGGKSSTLAGKIAVAELLTTVMDGDQEVPLHRVPPGDVGYFAMVSAEKPQAKARLATAKKALVTLGFSFEVATTEELVLSGGKRLGIKAVTASKKAAVSFTCIGALLDEMALWQDEDTKDNPASDVVELLKPTVATMPYARIWYVSAPWAELGLHYEMMEAGDNEKQVVFHGASWDMNPTLTEEHTHKLARDFIEWQRAYAAIPLPADERKFFNGGFIDLAAKPRLESPFFDRIVSGGDFAFRRDSAAVVVLGKYGENLKVLAADQRVPGEKPLKPSKTISELSEVATKRGADSLACDLHYIETVRETLEGLPIGLLEYPSHDSDRWYVKLRMMLGDDQIDLSRAPESLITQMKACMVKPLDGGRLKIEVKRSEATSHGDMLSALVCAVWAADQAPPLDDMTTGERRYPRGKEEQRSDGMGVMHDLPPTD